MSGTDVPAVLSLALQRDEKVIIGGAFTAVNGVTRYRIARLNVDGSVDRLFHNGGQLPPVLNNVGIQSDRFVFQLSGQSNQVVVVEASTNLLNWLAISTNRLSSNPIMFSDPVNMNTRMRLYRARLQ